MEGNGNRLSVKRGEVAEGKGKNPLEGRGQVNVIHYKTDHNFCVCLCLAASGRRTEGRRCGEGEESSFPKRAIRSCR